MSQLSVRLEDIPDVVGWVRWQVSRFCANGHPASNDEFEERVGQGTLILFEIHARWDCAKSPRFSAFALSMFQKRMIDWWRSEVASSGRGHVPRTHSGPRGAIVYHGTASLDGEAVVAFSQDRALTHYDAVEA